LLRSDEEAEIALPPLELDETELEEITAQVSRDSDSVIKLAKFAGHGLIRKLNTKQSRALIRYRVAVSDALDRVVILDASDPIKALVSYDKSISRLEIPNFKDYSSVSINVADFRSSKSFFEENKRNLPMYLRELDYLLNNVLTPDKGDVLIFTYKDLVDDVRSFVQSLGLNHCNRTHIVHWGSHKGVNRYSDVRNVVTIGVLYRDERELAASIIGQSRDLSRAVSDQEIKRTQHSEQADLLYQAFSRGHCRKTIAGRAGDMLIYLFHPVRDYPSVLRLLNDVMPGVSIREDYKPLHLRAPIHANALSCEALCEAIMEELSNCPPDCVRVSSRQLLKVVGPGLSNSKTWRKAAERASDRLVDWKKEGASFVRITAEELAENWLYELPV
jgi:hypothetical protein